MKKKKQVLPREITTEDFSEWEDSKVTQVFYKLLEYEIELANSMLLTLVGSVEVVGTEYIKKRAYIDACSNILDLTVDDMNFILEESEHEI